MHHREAFGNGLALWRRHLPDQIWHASLSLAPLTQIQQQKYWRYSDSSYFLERQSTAATVTVADVFSFYNTVGDLRNTTIGWLFRKAYETQ